MGSEAAAWAGFDEWAGRRMRHDGTPGLTLVVTGRERTARLATYGFADLAARLPVTPETRFEFGSIGKSFTALVLLRMRERGLVDFDAPLTKYLPWFAVRSRHPPITIHHLLCHTAGIVGGTDVSLDGRFESWWLRGTEVSGPPGAHFRYSNVGYKTLGWVIEDLTGKPYGDVVREEILAPLGMSETVVPFRHAHRARMAVGYRGLYDDRPYRPEHGLVPTTWLECGTADGSLAATPADMATYLRLLLNRGAYPGGRLVGEVSFDLMTRPHAERLWGDEHASYGYGWMRMEFDGRPVEGHGGGMVGYYSSLMIDPATGLGAFTSINGPGDHGAIASYALKVADAVCTGQRPPDPPTIPDRCQIDDRSIAGAYESGSRRIELHAAADGIVLCAGEVRAPLLARGGESYLVDHPAWDRFPLRVRKHDDRIVGLTYGDVWFARVGVEQPPAAASSNHWSSFTGAYRCWNPWVPFFRVVVRRGTLLLIEPEGGEKPLIPREDGSFQIGEDPSPERIGFDALAAGRAMRAVVNGQAYYRQPEDEIPISKHNL